MEKNKAAQEASKLQNKSYHSSSDSERLGVLKAELKRLEDKASPKIIDAKFTKTIRQLGGDSSSSSRLA